MNIILFGPPGAGKGTQAQHIVKKYNYFHLSTGDLLREETKKKTHLSKLIEKTIEGGNFVTDNIVNKLLRETISNLKFRDRIIFDGYPRSIPQAEYLDNLLHEFDQKINLIFCLSVPREIIKKRIIGRITCSKCNLTLNQYFDKKEIQLHPCGNKYFSKRKDDNIETVMFRYDVYKKMTQPVLDYLAVNSNFNEIDGTLQIDEITKEIERLINV